MRSPGPDRVLSPRAFAELLDRHVRDREMQRWSGHGQVHEHDQVALTEALTRTERAIELAQAAHRREHDIELRSGAEADAAHQLRHEQMNEFRAQLDRQALTFARGDLVEGSFSAVDRRLDEMRAAALTYRDDMRAEALTYRDHLQSEIASLRESRSMSSGVAEHTQSSRIQSNWSTGLLVTVGGSVLVAIIAASISIVTLIVTHH